jgi:hypothetical protein
LRRSRAALQISSTEFEASSITAKLASIVLASAHPTSPASIASKIYTSHFIVRTYSVLAPPSQM